MNDEIILRDRSMSMGFFVLGVQDVVYLVSFRLEYCDEKSKIGLNVHESGRFGHLDECELAF